ncbi:MAG TPA: hypothetical protein VIJ47_07520 [Acidimicrobiales bacterium]
MPDIGYVCLSDLHLGAANSTLTNLGPDGTHAPGPAPLLVAVLTGLRHLFEQLGTAPPTLVMHGDLFELALTTTETAADTFGHFVTEAWGGHARALFAPEVLFVPGNHDHHLWEIARQRQYEAEIHDQSRPVGHMRHVTSMKPGDADNAATEPFIGDFARRALAGIDEGQSPTFRVLYPNLGLVDEAGERAVVVTHGHYLEPMYRAMTHLHNVVTPDRPPRLNITQLEADNWAWIDFFWSTMGRSGEGESAGGDNAIPVLYELLQSQDSMNAIVDRVIDDLRPRTRSLVRGAQRMMLRRAGREVAAAVARRERHHAGVLSPEATTGLINYLAGPVHGQLLHDFGRIPTRVDLVFGHTHKPFAARRHPVGYPGPVVAHNTGGWVVDAVEPEPMKGASITLVGADLEVVDLSIYRQETDPARYRVKVTPVSDAPDEDTPLRAALLAAIDPDAEPWAAIARSAAETVAERQRQLDERIRAGTIAVRTEPPIGPRGW